MALKLFGADPRVAFLRGARLRHSDGLERVSFPYLEGSRATANRRIDVQSTTQLAKGFAVLASCGLMP